MDKQIRGYIGSEVKYNPNGRFIVSEDNIFGTRMIVVVKAFGVRPNVIGTGSEQGNAAAEEKKMSDFQDAVGEWVADAINQKLKTETQK